MALAAVFCVPLVETVAMDQGVAGTPRCRAINDYVFERIREIKPDVLVVGGYFAQYDHEANWRYPGFLDALVAGARSLHDDGVALDRDRGRGSDLGAGAAHPGRARPPRNGRGGGILAGRRPPGLARDRPGARREGLGPGRRLRVAGRRSSAAPQGCRRLVGPNLPDDLLAVDYGHYSVEGSIFAVKTILAPGDRRGARKDASGAIGRDRRSVDRRGLRQQARARSTGSARGRRTAASTSELIGSSSA